MSASHSEPTEAPRASDATDTALTELYNFDLTDNVSHLLRRAHVKAEAIFEDQLKDFNTTPRQKALLMASLQHPGASINQLADGIALDRNSTKEMLDRLVQRGLLFKTRSEEDRRAWQIDITPEGIEFLKAILPGDRAVEASLLERVPDEYLPLLIKCLRLLSGVD